MKGVLICGGTGSRLKPLTDVMNKSLLPVYDRPLIDYPLGILLSANIREIFVISGTEHLDQMEKYLANRENFAQCAFQYCLQKKPEGIAQALGMAEEFADGDTICAILGDNIYFDDLAPTIKNFQSGAHVFLKEVPDAERFGVAEIRGKGKEERGKCEVLNIEEKPKKPKSNLAVTGCYLYDSQCFEVIRNLKPSARGEFEITDVSKWYLSEGKLTASVLQDEWIDAGTFESLHRAAVAVRARKKL